MAGRTIRERDDEILDLRGMLGERDDQVNALREELYQMEGRMQELSQSEQTISYLTTEVDTWKNKVHGV
jgi:predicted RNase H-like nuclease (RuvC/YqgF family)